MQETHHERTYPIADIVAQLKAVGFVEIEVSADFGEKAVDDQDTRWFFHAKKA